jgi:hypothetical protein
MRTVFPAGKNVRSFKLFQLFKQFKRFERLERSFMEECGGNGEGVCGEFWRGGMAITLKSRNKEVIQNGK